MKLEKGVYTGIHPFTKKEEKIKDIEITDELKIGTLVYSAAGVIRFLPNVIDGLKDVQRKIIYTMYKNHYFYNHKENSGTKKNNNVIGDTVPLVETGDSGMYGALIRLGQIQRYTNPLLVIQGNQGYVSNGLDEFAAQRYTESALSSFTRDFYFPPEWEKSDFAYDNTTGIKYPTTLPSLLPMHYVMGTTGTTKGYKNDCPPHSLKGVAKAYIKYLEEINSTHILNGKKLNDYILANMKPKFPNNSKILGDTSSKGLFTGKGRVIIEGKLHYEDISYGRKKISITELPYLQNIPDFILSIQGNAKCRELFSEIHDYSSKEGTLIEIIVKKESDINECIELIKFTTPFRKQCNYTLNYNDNRVPRILNIIDVFKIHYNYRLSCILQYYNEKLDKLNKKKLNLEALKYILEDKTRRDAFFEILKKSDKESIFINMYKKYKKGFPKLNDEAISYIVDSKFNLFMNKSYIINDEIKKIDIDLNDTNEIVSHPEIYMIKSINEKVALYKS